MDNILRSQRSPTIKTDLGFHEYVEGESSSQGEASNSNAKSEMLNKDMRGKPHQQPRKESLQRKYFTPNYESDSRLFPPMNNVECFICHNFGHVAPRCRSRMVQDCHTERSSHSRFFKGYCFPCNMFGQKAIDYYRRNIKHVRCYVCNKFGHIANKCMGKFWPPY